MSWDGDEVEDLLIVTTGDATPEALDAMVMAAVNDPRYRPEMTVLIDLRRTRLAAMTHEEVRRRADLIELRAGRVGPQRVAFLVRDKADFGILRQLQGLTEETRSHMVGIFMEPEPARAWLSGTDPE